LKLKNLIQRFKNSISSAFKNLKQINRRNVVLVAIGTGVLAFLIILIFSLPQSGKKSDPFRAIPTNAELILEIKKPITFWKESSENSAVWQHLLAFENFAEINRNITFLDSLLKGNNALYNSLSNDPMLISFHKNETGKTSFLFVIPNTSGADEEDIEKVVTSSVKSSSVTSRKFEHCSINELRKNNAEPVFTYFISNNLFIGSCNGKLAESSAKQLRSEVSLLDNAGFKAVYETAGKNSNANIFINYKMFAPMAASFAGKPYQTSLSDLGDFAQWSALDLNLKNEIALANGYTSVSETAGKDFLGCFTGQIPAKIRIADIAPASTLFMVSYGFSDFTKWNKNYLNYLSQKNLLKARNQSIAKLNKETSTDIEKQLLPCIGKEMALLVTAPGKGDTAENYYAVFKTSNFEKAVMLMKPVKLKEEAIKKVKKTDKKSSKSKNKNKKTEKVKTEEPVQETSAVDNIFEYDAPGAFEALFGKLFAPVTGKYYSFAGDYIVFANSKNALKHFLSDQKNNNTLSQNNDYSLFSNNISEEANIFIYSNVAASSENLKNYLSESLRNIAIQQTSLFGNFESFAFQAKADGKLFYNNLCLISGAGSVSASNTLWDVKLDTSILFKPIPVDDVTGKGRAVAVFDYNNNFYIIDVKGNITLKVRIDGKPLGIPTEIDLKQKSKKQYVFNTATQLYSIDNTGKETEGFPIRLKATATAPMTVADYGGNKDYRFIIPCGNALYNYTKTGEINSGWTIPQTKNPILKKVVVVKFTGSDCIVITDKDGILSIVDRKGKEKISIKQPFTVSALSEIYSGNVTDKKGKLLITTDNQGKLVFINEQGVVEHTSAGTYGVSHFFMFEDFNGDGKKDFIFLDQNKLTVLGQNLRPIATYTFSMSVDNDLIFLKKAGKKGMFGAYSTCAGKIFVIKPDGLLKEGFPLTGSTPFFVESLAKNGELNLIVGYGRHILNYAFE
jgi:hypothetical protein